MEIGDNTTGSWRRVTFITPNDVREYIKIVSTVYSFEHNEGETAIAWAFDLNYLCIDLTRLDYIVVKKHKSEQEALEFHEKLCKGNAWRVR